MVASVFAVQNLRLHMIESNSNVHVGVVFIRFAISFNADSKNPWIAGINRHFIDAYGNLRLGGSMLKELIDLFGSLARNSLVPSTMIWGVYGVFSPRAWT